MHTEVTPFLYWDVWKAEDRPKVPHSHRVKLQWHEPPEFAGWFECADPDCKEGLKGP